MSCHVGGNLFVKDCQKIPELTLRAIENFVLNEKYLANMKVVLREQDVLDYIARNDVILRAPTRRVEPDSARSVTRIGQRAGRPLCRCLLSMSR